MENKELIEQRQTILNAVSKFLNRDNLYSTLKATHPHTPTISMKSIGGAEPDDIVSLYLEDEIYFINGEFVTKQCLVAYLCEENKIVWNRIILPVERFPEAYKMFFDKYENLSGKKEEIEKYRKDLAMFLKEQKEAEQKQEQEQQTKESCIDYTDKEVDECLKDVKDVQTEFRQQHIEKHISKCSGKTQQEEGIMQEKEGFFRSWFNFYKDKAEQENIIKNAMEFLNRDDLTIDKNNDLKIISTNDTGIIKDITGKKFNDDSLNYIYNAIITYKYPNDTDYKIYWFSMVDNKELFKLFQSKLNSLLKANNKEQLQELTLEEWCEKHSLRDYIDIVRENFKQQQVEKGSYIDFINTRNEEYGKWWNSLSEEEKEKEYLKKHTCKCNTEAEPYKQKDDNGKPMYLSVPSETLKAICQVDEYGAKKYRVGNWLNISAERFINATLRHLYAMQTETVDEQGRKQMAIDLSKKDNESGIEHLKHAICSLSYAVAVYEKNKEKEV